MMTLMQNIIKLAGYNLFRERNFVIIKSTWNVERYFGSKLEIPSPPKRPLTAYMIFCKENRKELLKENPSLSNTDQIKILAKKWNLLTEEMKKPYEVSARENTQMYGIEHKKFYESLTEEQKEELARLKAKKIESRRLYRQKKALRESGLPKAPNTAYALFVQSEAKKKPAVKSGAVSMSLNKLSKLGNLLKSFSNIPLSEAEEKAAVRSGSEFIKKVAELWKALPEESKKVFEKQAEEEKMRYAQEMKEWRTRMLLEGNKKILKAYEELKSKGKSLDFDEEESSEKKKSTVKKSTKADSAISKH